VHIAECSEGDKHYVVHIPGRNSLEYVTIETSRQNRNATIHVINHGMHSPSYFLDSSNRWTTEWYSAYVTSMRVVEESVHNCCIITWWPLIRCNSDTRSSVYES
jgi:hypothetical protein